MRMRCHDCSGTEIINFKIVSRPLCQHRGSLQLIPLEGININVYFKKAHTPIYAHSKHLYPFAFHTSTVRPKPSLFFLQDA